MFVCSKLVKILTDINRATYTNEFAWSCMTRVTSSFCSRFPMCCPVGGGGSTFFVDLFYVCENKGPHLLPNLNVHGFLFLFFLFIYVFYYFYFFVNKKVPNHHIISISESAADDVFGVINGKKLLLF